MNKKNKLLTIIAVLLLALDVLLLLLVKNTIEKRVHDEVSAGFAAAIERINNSNQPYSEEEPPETIDDTDYSDEDDIDIENTGLRLGHPDQGEAIDDYGSEPDDFADDSPSNSPEVREPTRIATGIYAMTGLIDNEYPIRARITITSSGTVSGKYAYESTLRNNGDKSSSWITIKGKLSGSAISLSQVCPGATEPWPDIEGTFSEANGKLFFSGSWTHNNRHTITLN